MPARRFSRSLRHASLAAKSLIRPALTKRGFGEARLLTEWESVAGVSIAEMAQPLRVTWSAKEGIGGTLILGVLGSRALEIQHLVPQIVERVNAHYGYRAISRIRLEQVGADALVGQRRKKEMSQPCPKAAARVTKGVTSVQNDGLRAALGTLGQHVAAREAPLAIEKE